MTKNERTERLKAAGKNLSPKFVAQKIIDNEEKYQPEAVWIASNYQKALAYIKILEASFSLIDILIKYTKIKDDKCT